MAAALFIGILSAGCGRGKGKGERAEELQMVSQCVDISRLYADSMMAAKDSAAINRLMTNYDNALTAINYHHTPELYLHLTESENDSISKITMRIIEIRDSLLGILAGISAPIDSNAFHIPYRLDSVSH